MKLLPVNYQSKINPSQQNLNINFNAKKGVPKNIQSGFSKEDKEKLKGIYKKIVPFIEMMAPASIALITIKTFLDEDNKETK